MHLLCAIGRTMNYNSKHASNKTLVSPAVSLSPLLTPEDPAVVELNGTAMITTFVERYRLSVG